MTQYATASAFKGGGGAASVITTEGDIIRGSSGGTDERLALGSNGLVLTSNGTTAVWSAVAGTGDVVGPGSATNNAIARYDTTTGKLLQNSVVTIADSTGNMAGVGTLNTHTIQGGTGTLALTTDITGDVAGPGSATNNAIARYDTTSGKLLQDSGVTITDTGEILAQASNSPTSPAYSFSGDLTTGIYHPGANQISISTNGLERFGVGSTGIITFGDDGGGTEYEFPAARGTNNQVLVTDGSGVITWQAQTAGFTDPMTTDGDIIIRDETNTTVRLAAGTSGQILQTNGNTAPPTWETKSTFDDLSPMTTGGDVIYGGASGTGTRLANGAANQVLTSAGTTLAPTWETPSAGNLTGHITSTGLATVLGSFTSLQLKTALTDETGSGAAVFATSPTFVTPALGTPASGVGTNLTGTAAGLTAGNVTTNANLTGGVTSVGNAATVITNANLTGDITSSGNATTYAGTVPINKGGTGATTALAGFDALSPMTTGGDILYGGASGTATRLANGTANQVLTSNGTTLAPTWENSAAGFSDPMTTRGDLIFKNSGGTTVRLAAGTNNQVLTSDGTDIAWEDAAGGGSEATPTVLGTTTSYISTVQDRINSISSANYTVLDGDGYDTLLVTTSSSNRTMTLPTASANDGRILWIKKADDSVGTVIVDGEGAETIEGATTQTLYNQFESIKIVCNGTSWFIMDRQLSKTPLESLTLTAGTALSNLTTVLAEGFAFNDTADNWWFTATIRFEADFSGSDASMAITGVVFEDTTDSSQAIVGWINDGTTLSTQTIDHASYALSNTGNLHMVDMSFGNDLRYSTAFTLRLKAKPSWA